MTEKPQYSLTVKTATTMSFPYKVVTTNVLHANSYLLTQPAEMQQHQHSFGVHLESNIHSHFSSNLVSMKVYCIHQRKKKLEASSCNYETKLRWLSIIAVSRSQRHDTIFDLIYFYFPPCINQSILILQAGSEQLVCQSLFAGNSCLLLFEKV